MRGVGTVLSISVTLILVAELVVGGAPIAGSAREVAAGSDVQPVPTSPPRPTPQAAPLSRRSSSALTLERQPGSAPKTGALMAQSTSTIHCTDHRFISYSGDPDRVLTFGGDVSCDGAMDHTVDADLHLVQGGVPQDRAEAVAPQQACTGCLSLSTSGTFGPATPGTTHRNFYRPVHTAPAGYVWTQWDPA